MALTRVSGNIIDQPFDVGIITATNQYVSGIGTFGNIRVLGDLQVDGTTTTLDTVVTEVDRLEIGANNSTVGVAITQSGTGDILNLYDGSTEVFSVADGGDVSIIDKIVHAGDTNTTIRFPAADTITAETDGSERLRITSGGNVGINTITPSEKLDVWGTIRASQGTNQYMHMYPVAGAGYFDVKNATTYPSIVFRQIGSAGTQERLRITSGGNVGIGTDNPDELLEVGNGTVVGGLKVSGQSSSVTSDGLTVDWESSSNSTRIFSEPPSGGSSVIRLFTTDSGSRAERLRIASNGNIGIGTDDPQNSLHINGASPAIRFSDTGANGSAFSIIEDNNGLLKVRNDAGNSGSGSGIAFEVDAAERLRILADGTVDFKDNNISNVGTIALDLIKGDADDNTNITFAGNDTITFKTGSTSPALTINTTQVKIEDNQKFVAGAGNDLQIYHNGTHSYIENNTGGLYMKVANGEFLSQNGSEIIAKFLQNSAVELYYDNSKKFDTTATGAKITGALEVTQEYPSIRPTLDLNFAATKTLDRRITFTRDSFGTFTDDMGIVRYASNNVPRFDHDPTTGESLGLLIEESRTNILNYSDLISGYSGSWWRNSGTTVSRGSDVTAPDGTVSAWNTVYNGTSGDGNVVRHAGEVTTSNSTVYTLSLFAKIPSTNTYIQGVRIRTYNSNHSCQFNLSTGTIVGTSEGTTTNRMEAYPNGWYRCSITFTSGTDGNQGVQFYLMNNSNNTLLNDSNANGEALYLWGAQLEASAFPTSYIPTGSSAVTRAADITTIKGTNFTDFYNQTEGTAFVHALMPNSVGASGLPAYAFKTSANSNYHLGFSRDNTGAYHYIRTSDANTYTYESLVNEYRAVLGIKTNDLNSYINDANQNVNLSTITLFDADILYLGYTAASNVLNGHIKRFSYYPKRLPDAQLRGLTQQ